MEKRGAAAEDSEGTVVVVAESEGAVDVVLVDVVVDSSATTHPLDVTKTAARAPARTKDRITATTLTVSLRIIERMVGYLRGQVNDTRASGCGARTEGRR